MRGFWLTTHWPHHFAEHPWNIYLQAGKPSAVSGIQLGDKIIFYEFLGGRRMVGWPPLPPGRGGVVCVARVAGALRARVEPQTYTDRTELTWAWEVACADHDFDGFVDRASLNRILEYSPKYTLRGLGGNSGVRRISEHQFEKLCTAFRQGKRT